LQNIGLQAKILSTRTFTIFVVMALVTTVSTTPLTTLLYPLWYQKKLEAWKRGDIDWDGNDLRQSSDSQVDSLQKIQSSQVRKLLVYLRLESLPSLFTFIALLGGDKPAPVPKVHKSKTATLQAIDETTSASSDANAKRPLEVYGVRMLPLTERTSSVMKVSETDEYATRDPVVNAFRTFAQLNDVAVSGSVAIIPESSFADELTSKASDLATDLVLIPWAENGTVAEGDSSLGSGESTRNRFSSGAHTSFVTQALENALCNVAVFVNSGFGGPPLSDKERRLNRTASHLSSLNLAEVSVSPVADRSHHIFFPFLGGVDDRVALRFVLQLARNSNITATILHVKIDSVAEEAKAPTVVAESSTPRPAASRTSTKSHIAPVVAPATQAEDAAFLHALRDSLPATLADRVAFGEIVTAAPVASVLEEARTEVGQSPGNAGDLVVLGRNREAQLGEEEAGDIARTLGGLAESVILGGVRASVLVVQAAGRGLET